MDTEVLIVGAGPTGLMLANQLARRGLRPLIIERNTGPALQTRALGVQARTLEIYQHLGIAAQAVENGQKGMGANLWADGRKMARVTLAEAGADITRFPFILILGQDENERLLGERLRAQGMTVTWNTELLDLQQKPDRVTVTLRGPDDAILEKEFSWVAGCDGAHSAVRRLASIDFPGAAYGHTFFVADTEVTGEMVPDEVNVFLWRQGFHLFFPMRGLDHWRIVGIVPPELRERDDLTLDSVTPSLLREANELRFRSCSWFSTYRIHHRSAAHFRAGRCFLLGDAAHIHSPVGAQGMNTGLQDAYNLAWKLALVLRGEADDALLDTYESERLPVAQRLLNTTDRAFRLVVSDSPLAGLLRTQLLARIMAFGMRRKAIQRAAFRVVSQTGIRYRHSRLSQATDGVPVRAPHAGDRFPWLKLRLRAQGPVEDLFEVLDDTRFTLLLIGQELPDDRLSAAGALSVCVIPQDAANARELKRAHIPRRCFYLLRPDGHIGLCGLRLHATAIRAYLSVRVGMRPR